jgi:tetratricopeptide (TPR) repeat protein
VRPAGIAVVALALALAGCGRATRTDSGPDCSCAGEAVVDPALLAFLGKARAAHHQADLAEEQGDRARAVQALEALGRGPRPAPLPPEAAEVLADTLARLADLRSQGGDGEAALRDVQQGLALAAQPSHFRGHLYEILGVVHERRARALTTAGDEPGAARARAQALDAFDAAIKIQDQVIDEALARKRDGG